MLTISALLAGGCVAAEGAAQEQVTALEAVSDSAVPLPPKRPERAAPRESVSADATGLPGGEFWHADLGKAPFRQVTCRFALVPKNGCTLARRSLRVSVVYHIPHTFDHGIVIEPSLNVVNKHLREDPAYRS